MTRTIEVLPTNNEYNNWKVVFSGSSGRLFFDKKKKAISRAKLEARQTAELDGYSVGVKIFGKDGEYQRQHVYDP